MPYVGIYDWLKREMLWMLRTTLSVRLTVFCFNVHTVRKFYFEHCILINDEGKRERNNVCRSRMTDHGFFQNVLHIQLPVRQPMFTGWWP